MALGLASSLIAFNVACDNDNKGDTGDTAVGDDDDDDDDDSTAPTGTAYWSLDNGEDLWGWYEISPVEAGNALEFKKNALSVDGSQFPTR